MAGLWNFSRNVLSSNGRVTAAADRPDGASFAVMRRLGMCFHKEAHYPFGAGADYVLRRDGPGSTPAAGVVAPDVTTQAYGRSVVLSPRPRSNRPSACRVSPVTWSA